MNIFSAPNWDIDEASAAISSSAFGGTILTKAKKSKSASKQSVSLASSNSTAAEGLNPRFVRAKQLRRLKRRGGKAKETTSGTEGSLVSAQSRTGNDFAGSSGFKIGKKIGDKGFKERSINRLRIPSSKENRRVADNSQNAIDLRHQTTNESPNQQVVVLTKDQKKALKKNLKQLKQKSQSNSKEDFLKTKTAPDKVKIKNGERNGKIQSKLGKLLELQKRKKRAEKAIEICSTSVTTDSGNTEISNQQTSKSKLKKKEKRLKKKHEALLKLIKTGDTSSHQNGRSQNELVLSKNKKKKMRKIAKRLSQESFEKETVNQKEQGTANPSFNESISESVHELSHNDQETKAKRKKNGKKQQSGPSDSVDGNFVKASNPSAPKGFSPSTKHYPPAVFNSSTELKKSKKKKMVVAKLLQEANIMEKSTLHDLKKKRQSSDHLSPGSSKKKSLKPVSLREKMADQLKSARFRWLNEQLYTSDSWEAHKYFKEDPEAYEAYHSGYRNQVAQWPLNPLDVIIKSISSMPKETVVADFGCGDARLAEALSHLSVHSFDLVAKKPGVTACDMAHTPLLMESVNVAVFCLSLMGKNLNDFILEANRVLKMGGLLLIAEVESRFDDIDNFTSAMVNFGFHLKKKDVSHQMFIFMDFKKTRKVSKTGKLPALALDPCVYKKR